ncbi:uncharacterized protein LOC134202692 [Armigeres subalbatus]|uniref:uncharacterized protein LOC134202692 n=1 Tax=Armigeres subalbatus TaxID=124917 RepID=UPI002ED54DF9
MTAVTSSSQFFQKGNSAQFEFLLDLYPQALKVKAENRGAGKKPEKLIRLDDWYQNTLPKLIQKRGKDAHLLHEELVQLMEWKQTRGKSYPQLTHLIKINTPRAVMMETKKAFRKLPNLEQALNALSNLKGVGTTMASALLAAACPETAPFMADECLMAIPDFESIDYTVKEYLKFVTHIQTTADRLNKEFHGPETENNGAEENGAPKEPPKPKKWTAHKVEMALWAHYVASDLQPELLKGMPESNGVSSTGSAVTVSVANGSGAVPDLDNEDDSSQNGVPPSDESNMDSESASKDATALTNGAASMNTDSMDGSENGNPAPAEAATSSDVPADSLDDCTKSGDSLDEAPAVEATAAAVATLCTADGEDSQSSNSQKRPLYCDENSEEQPELSAPKLIKL